MQNRPLGDIRLYQSITKWSLYLLFFLVPIFFLPWTSNFLEINKQMLLVVLAVVALVAWLGIMVAQKRLSFRSGWLNLVPALFLVTVLISSVFSLAGYQSWVGQASQEYTSFLSILMFVLLFYVLMNTASSRKIQGNIIFALLLSSALSGLVALFGMFNLLHLPFDFAQSTGFNTIGTVNGFITFMTAMMFMGLAMWLVSSKGTDRLIPEGNFGTFLRVLVVIITLANLVALISIDYWVFWVINIFGVLLLAAFGFIQGHEFPEPKRFVLPLIILVVSVLLLFLQSPVRANLPVVVSPSYGTSFDIAKDTVFSSPMNALFGSGPGTFMHDYLQYKPATINASQFWNMRFDRAKSSVITIFATFGIIGTLLWIVLMVWVAAKSLGRLIKDREHSEWKLTYVLFVAWAVLMLSHILYSSNFTMQFVLWGLTGLLASHIVSKTWSTDFSSSPRLGLGVSFAFVVVAVGVVASLFITGQRYAAEVAFAKAVDLDGSGADITEVIEELGNAVNHNGLSDIYYRNLSSALLIKTRKVIAEAGGADLTSEQIQQVNNLVSASVNAAARATDIEPNNVSNWSIRGSVYRDLMSYARGAEDLAAASYQNAIRLEPVNPIHRANLGRVFLTVAERARALKNAENAELAQTATLQEKELLSQAEVAFQSAIELKPDYATAHYYLAATFERQGRLNDAASRLIALRNNSPTDIGLGFQLGVMLLRLQRYDLAQQEFERLIGLAPNYSNALWYLASAYELQRDRDSAITALERVKELNPGNESVDTRLARMKAGELTTVIPQPVEVGEESATVVPEGEIIEEPSSSAEATEDGEEEVVEEDVEEDVEVSEGDEE